MVQEQKDLLFKDLCARLPYKVKAEKYTIRTDGEIVPHADVETVTVKDIITQDNCPGYIIKPYLFPMSSMTEEQMKELEKLCDMYIPEDDYNPYIYKGIAVLYKHLLDDGYEVNIKTDVIDFFHKNHLDYREGGLIPKGLANDATNLNIY